MNSGRNSSVREKGFTIVEVMVSLAVIVLFVSVVFWAQLMMNKQAAIARLYTGALAAAQSQIDAVQNLSSTALSNAYSSGILSTTAQQVSIASGSVQLSSTPATVIVYSDPQLIVSGSLGTYTGNQTTTLKVTGTTALGTGNFHYYSANVTVSYLYCSSTYTLTLQTARSDAP